MYRLHIFRIKTVKFMIVGDFHSYEVCFIMLQAVNMSFADLFFTSRKRYVKMMNILVLQHDTVATVGDYHH